MRLLFARVGVPYSPATGLPIESQTVARWSTACWRSRKARGSIILAPIVRGRKGEYRKELAELQKKGFQRVKVDGTFYEIADVPALDKKYKHDIDVVVDRIVVRADLATRLAEFHRDGAEARRRPRRRRIRRQAARRQPDRRGFGQQVRERNPRTHSFLGEIRLPGLGLHHPRDRAAAVLLQQPVRRLPGLRRARQPARHRPQPGRARREPARCATAPSARGRNRPRPITRRRWRRSARSTASSSATASASFPTRRRTPSCTAPATTEITFSYDDGLRSYKTTKTFEGVIPNLERRWKETESAWMREEIERFMSATPCPACNGYRLKPEALAVKIAGLHIGQVSEMSIRKANQWFDGPAGIAQRQAERDRRAHPQGDPRAAALPQRCRPRLPHPVAQFRHAVGRREPAHPARLADRLRPHRRALRARRAVDRPAPARQCPPARHAEAPARHRQHGHRRRA